MLCLGSRAGGFARTPFDEAGRDAEARFYPFQPVIDFCSALEFIRDGALDDGAAKPAPLGRLDRWSRALAPGCTEIVVVIAADDHFQLTGLIAERAVFGGVCHHLVNDERHHRIGFRRDHGLGPLHIQAVLLAGQIGIGFGFDEFRKRGVRPVALGDIVMG